jgi:hypothetical protein
MDKLTIKAEINDLKEELIKHKAKYKLLSENHKRQIEGLKQRVSIQTSKDSAASMRREIARIKDSFVRNEKRMEKEGVERIKSRIVYLKSKLV